MPHPAARFYLVRSNTNDHNDHHTIEHDALSAKKRHARGRPAPADFQILHLPEAILGQKTTHRDALHIDKKFHD